MNYIAIAINKDYWVKLSKPCTKQQAEMFKGSQMIGEIFAIKTEKEVNQYKYVL